MTQQILFYAFAAVLVASALAVITVKNSVHAALCLVLTFFTAASIWILAEAEFLGLAPDHGRIAVGGRADFVLLDADLTARATWIGGARG